MELWLVTAGALQGMMLYDPGETWGGLATVVTLCGVYRALPVAAGQRQSPRHASQTGRIRGFCAPLLEVCQAHLAKYNIVSLHYNSLPLMSTKHRIQSLKP